MFRPILHVACRSRQDSNVLFVLFAFPRLKFELFGYRNSVKFAKICNEALGFSFTMEVSCIFWDSHNA
jgi:hypothetical protein